MVFATAVKAPRARVKQVRFAINPSGTSWVGQLTIPPDVLERLGWTDDLPLEVLIGAGEDHGWFALRANPELTTRARLSVTPSGVGRFISRALVPPGNTGGLATTSPPIRINEEDDILIIRLH